MSINALQPILRGATGKELQFTGDFHAYWDQLGLPPGQFAERMAAWKALPQNAAWIDATEDADAAEVVAGLWKNGEQGVWYDPSDLSTMYQDWAGTTPAYTPGQGLIDPPVGLILDKRFGSAKGPELWVDASVQLSGEASRVSPGVYRVYTSAGAYTAVQLSGLIAGEWYELSLNVDLITTLGGGLACDVTTPIASFSSVGPKKYLLRTNTNVIAIKRNAIVPTDIQISNVSVRRISGNHAFQSTTTSRPALSGRYNLLTNTNFSGAVVGAPGTPPTGWSANFSTASITAVAPLGSDYAIQITANAQRLFFGMGFTALPSTTYSLTCFVVENSGLPMEQILGFTGVPTGATLQWYLNGGLVNGATTAPVNSRIEVRLVVGATGGTPAARVGIGTAINATGVVSVASPDVRVVGDGVGLPPYQRVVDAGTYDTAGFPLYLKFDGVDDFLQTGNVDFSGADKLIASAAIRKLSDAIAGVVTELSAVSNTSNGSFALLAPAGSNDTLAVYMRGATALTTSVPSGISSPASRVFTGVMDLSAAIGRQSQSRVNGARYSYASQNAGGGNFGGYPLYIGRRGGTGLPLNGRIYGLVIRSNSISEAQLAAVERYLNSKARAY